MMILEEEQEKNRDILGQTIKMKMILIIPFLMISCKDDIKKENTIKSKIETVKIVNIRTYFKDNINHMDEEVYVYNNGDSLVNQFKFYENKKVDTIHSNFYTLQLRSTDKGKYKGSIKYYSDFERFDKKKINERRAEFYYLQNINKDSVDFVKVTSTDLKTFNFDYVDFRNNTVQGMINETLSLDTIINGEKMVRILEKVTLIDNKNPTYNAYPLPKTAKFIKNKGIIKRTIL
ncbi:hypothetical protein [Flavobacterium sp. UBA4197]|uniref:hypothetical protein n=1 Tax=Flavobacterium sp. UBA4197 TaxID=1946546 RepID=UPI002579D2F4|nr:hypothetical protein [Flavobacterium sp. UBA4197]